MKIIISLNAEYLDHPFGETLSNQEKKKKKRDRNWTKVLGRTRKFFFQLPHN
jgi:hypothetical protein